MSEGDLSDRKDPELSRLLSEWKDLPPLPGRFREQVWRRIENTETAPPARGVRVRDWLAGLLTLLPRPALAAAYLGSLLLLGGGLGWTHARKDTERVNLELGIRYAQTVDPYKQSP